MVIFSDMFKYIIYFLEKHIHVQVFFYSTQKVRNNYCVLSNKMTVADDKKNLVPIITDCY